MVNAAAFASRLKEIMEYYGLNAASFAEAIEVNRSSISHLLSGRNKPSLDFVIKVIERFEEVELYWLLNGRGSFPNSKEAVAANKDMSGESTKAASADSQLLSDIPNATVRDTGIEQIIIFYKDGSFRTYRPN